MDGFPVTIRLIDPPLHEFVPHDADKQDELAKRIGISAEAVARRVEQLHEANPMLGHRGARLSITYPGNSRDAGARDHRGRDRLQKARH